ncbi:MAG: hypothetical protein HLUCCA11_01795 [Phormidesmis priestleyi Ana]|uniref:Uncharacterized protein n=1 Tax=Phormidesmis priestleyi Ana TaxID=1666911 RepID=A0A0N8KNQ4_9CYAN|nr:MAG: hypothetical protein HLUCCA11_01795 [Phormidesmis priestleyi Ana]
MTLPMTLLASPLLLAASQVPRANTDFETYGIYCESRENATTGAATAPGTTAQPISTSTGALVTSEQERSAVFGSSVVSALENRLATVRQLLRANPYGNGTSAAPSNSSQAARSARDNCLAVSGETLVASLPAHSLRLSELPDLSAPSTPFINSPPTPAPILLPAAVPAPLPTILPAAEPAAESVLEPTAESVLETVPESAGEPAAAPTAAPIAAPTAAPAAESTLTPAAIPPQLPSITPSETPALTSEQGQPGIPSVNGASALDPFNFTPTQLNPTPFDGDAINTLASMPDGNYRYISGTAEDRVYTDAELQQLGSAVFILKKQGNTVTGDLLPRIGRSGICVTGIVSGNVISGAAYPHDGTVSFQASLPASLSASLSDSLPGGDRSLDASFASYANGALKVRGTTRTPQGLYYDNAVLDLSNFSPINAGTSLPPTSCQAG